MDVYLDNGATTRMDDTVLKKMSDCFSDNYGNASSIHGMGTEARKALEEARDAIAKKIGAGSNEIIFTSGGTESDNLAIAGVANAAGKGHIITTTIEHPAVLGTCWMLERQGFSVTYVDVNEDGFVDPKDVEKAIQDDTILVSIMHANNEIGTIQNIEEIGKLIKAQKRKVYFHTDAVQSLTKTDIDVNKMGLDLVSLSAHKIHGPKGVGVLYVRKDTKLEKLMHGGAHEYKLRAGTENVPGAVGFAAACELDDKTKHITKLRDKLVGGLLEIEDTKLNGPCLEDGNRLCNNVNISFKNVEGESILLHLDMEGISVSTGSACSSKSLKPSHVLSAIGLKPENAHGSIRFTLSRYTTEKEIDYTIEKTKEVIDKLRKISPFKR